MMRQSDALRDHKKKKEGNRRGGAPRRANQGKTGVKVDKKKKGLKGK